VSALIPSFDIGITSRSYRKKLTGQLG